MKLLIDGISQLFNAVGSLLFVIIVVDLFIPVSVQQRFNLSLELLASVKFLNRETDNSTPHLHCHGVVFGQAHLVFEQNDRSKLAQVVLDVKSIFLAFDDCVAPRYRDVVDPHFGLVAATQLKLLLCGRDRQHVDIARGILVERH